MNFINTNVPSDLNLKICLIADIHFSYKFNKKTFTKIINNINLNKPDYICIVGDILDYTDIENIADIDNLYRFIKSLAGISKVIISLGNHDYTNINNKTDEYKYPKLFVNKIKSMQNVELLDNEILYENGICFIGYTQGYETYYSEETYGSVVAKEVSELINNIGDDYNILLSHDPLYIAKDEVIKNIKNYNKLNLILSGHTHNGMLPNFIKTNNLLITPLKRWFKKDGRGHMHKNGVDIIVNGGITKLSKKAGIFHIFNFLFKSNIDYITIGGNKNGGTKSKR